jgi:anhydro-N-acetylmuramic acid kinase
MDVARGGQGAPLVPIGDRLLFGKYEACLNIGGIANISFEKSGRRMAYDICEANMLLNYLAQQQGMAFDRDGQLARNGIVVNELLQKLNSLAFYKQEGARSLGREWFEQQVLPLLNENYSTADMLATSTMHVAVCIANDLTKHDLKNVLVTGGGALNKYLIELIGTHTNCKLIVPDADTVNFKEALIFAFLGYLCINGKHNSLSSVTGALSNSIGGAFHQAG